MLADDIRLPKVCGLYMLRCPVPTKQAGNKFTKRKAPVTLEYMEEERQEELFILDGIKDMKNLPGSQTFMSLPENGSMANEDSAILFQQRYAIPSWPKDRNSEHPNHKEAIAVKVADRIIDRTQHVKSKGIRTIDMNKKASEEDVLAARKKLKTEEATGAAASSQSREEVMQDLFGASRSGSGLCGREAADLQKMGQLDGYKVAALEASEDADAEDKKEQQDKDGGHSSTTATSKSDDKSNAKAKAKWFNRDDAVVTELNSHHKWKAKVTTDFQQLYDRMTQVRQKVRSEVSAEEVVNEVKLLDTRMQAVALVLEVKGRSPRPSGAANTHTGPSPEAIEEKKEVDDGDDSKKDDEGRGGNEVKSPSPRAKASEPVAAAPTPPPEAAATENTGQALPVASPAKATSQSGSSTNDPKKSLMRFIAQFGDESSMRGRLGSAPPCRSFRLLRCLSFFDQITEGINNAVKKEELVNLQSDYRTYKLALSDLLTMSKAATTRLEKAVHSAAENQANQKNRKEDLAKAKPAKVAKAAAAAAARIYDLVSASGKQIDTCREKEGKLIGLNWLQPAIWRYSQNKELDSEEKPLRACLDSFADKFKNDPSRTDPGRAQRKLTPDCIDAVEKLLNNVPTSEQERLSEVILKGQDAADLSKLQLYPIRFAVAKKGESVSGEFGHQSCIRLCWKGTRRVVLLKTMDIVKFLANDGVGRASVTMQKVYNFVKTVSSEVLKKFEEAHPDSTQHATIGPLDALYIPSGWVFGERLQGNDDYIGLRMPIVVGSLLEPMQALNEQLIACGKPNETLQSTIDRMILVDAD